MSFDVNADIRQAQEDAKRLKSKAYKDDNDRLLTWCPGCMERIYQKISKCPKCGYEFNWNKIRSFK